jgi:hypothetical protein
MGRFEDFGPYEDALDALKQLPNARTGFTYQDAITRLEITPGLFFTTGNTWQIIIDRMQSWDWLEKKEDKFVLKQAA